MDIITWIIVGLIAGFLASRVVGRSQYGLLGDIIVGIVGSFIGGWVFKEAGWRAPLSGLAGTIAIAFVGSVVLLLALHLVQRARLRA